jgi:FkbM family methyltransferase
LVTLFEEIWVNRCYAPSSLCLGPEDTVVDIGAHVGVFALWAATWYPANHLICVEPSSESFTILRRNCADNHLTNVNLVQCACAGYTGTSRLYSRGQLSMNTLYTRDGLGSSFQELERVPVISLDDLLAKFHIKNVGLLKLDCEGAEYEVLMSASEATLRRCKHIVLEYHLGLTTTLPHALACFLGEKGFEVAIHPPRSKEDGYLYAKRHN